MSYQNHEYIVEGTGGFNLSTALKLWKTKYKDFTDWKKDVAQSKHLHDFSNFVEECWKSIEKVSVKEAFVEENLDRKRVYFSCIGVVEMFKSLSPVLKDKQTITKNRAKWDDGNKETMYTFEDTYELYEIDGKKLFGKDKWGRQANSVYAVRCWCTTTKKEYWIYVNLEAATGERWANNVENTKFDAIRAIAWTIRIDITNPERIYRQGDIVIAEWSKDSKKCSPYHIDKQQYLKLMYAES